MRESDHFLVILGPTASGKTRLATQVAAQINGAIISADSRQVYRDMDIGTGKDLLEYQAELRPIPYYLIDIVDAGEKYNIFQYYQDYVEAYQDAVSKGYTPILCGGSGLYLETALKGHELAAIPIDPSLRERLQSAEKSQLAEYLSSFPEDYRKHADISSHKRLIRAIEIALFLQKGHRIPEQPAVPYKGKPIIVGIDIDRELRRKRITERLEQRLEEGMIQEVEGLLQRGIPPETLAYYGLEYKWVSAYLLGEASYSNMFEKLNTGIHRFAKRQMTWFRKMERQGWKIHWLKATTPLEMQVEQVMKLRNRA